MSSRLHSLPPVVLSIILAATATRCTRGPEAAPEQRVAGGAQPVRMPAQIEAIVQGTPARTRASSAQRAVSQGVLQSLNLGKVRQDPDRQWTVMAYLNADCNLESHILADLNEMEAGLPPKGVEVIALIDRSAEFDTSDGDWASARVYRLRPDQDMKRIKSELLYSSNKQELALGSPVSLGAFMAATLRTFPAQHYGLIMGGHGGGWAFMVGDDEPPGAKGVSYMSVDQFRGVISRVMRGRKLGLIALDMCLLGQLEVAAELQDVAEFLVASEAVVPGFGLPYASAISAMGIGSPRMAALLTAKAFGQHCDKMGNRTATISAMNLGHTGKVVDALNALLARVQAQGKGRWPDLCRSMFFAESYVNRTEFRKGRLAVASIDLLDSLKRMRKHVPEIGADKEFRDLTDALDDFLVYCYSGRRHRLSNGLAVYAPFRAGMLDPDYSKLKLLGTCNWLKLLGEIHRAQEAHKKPPTVTSVRLLERDGREAQSFRMSGGQRFEITVEGQNILWTMVENLLWVEKLKGYAVISRSFVPDMTFDERKKKLAQEASDLIDLMMPQYKDGRNVLTTPAVGITFKLTNGKQTCEAMIDYSDPGNMRFCNVPVIYTHPSVGQVPAELQVDLNWLRVVGITGFRHRPDGARVPFEIEPKADAVVTTYYVVTATGQKPQYMYLGNLKFDKGLKLTPVMLDPGRYALIAEAESITGHSARKSLMYELKEDANLAQWMKVAGRFTAIDLGGKWDWQAGKRPPGQKDYTFEPTGLTWEFRYLPKYPGSVDFWLQGKDVRLEGFVRVDTRHLPHLNVFTKIDPSKTTPLIEGYLVPNDDGYARTDFFVAFLVRQQGSKYIIMWNPTRELMFRAVPAGAATAPSPELLKRLAGRWQTANGRLVQVLTENTYETYRDGKLVDKGVYTVEGDRITTKSRSGRTDTEMFAMPPDGDTLVIFSASGKRTTLKRVKAQPAPAPAAQLSGRWKSASGRVVIVMTAEAYENLVAGKSAETGTYKVDGNKITTCNAKGVTETQTFELKGDKLTLIGKDGKKSVFTRVK